MIRLKKDIINMHKGNKKQLLVSVIVPAYNEEKHIEQCLLTIKLQTYPNVQLIVVNDGSTDKTKEIAKKYTDVFLYQKHHGPGIARNNGAKVAKGKILVFVDADMYFDKDYITNLIQPILKKGAVATFTNEEYVANPENIWVKCFQIDNNLLPNSRMKKKLLKSRKLRAITKDKFLATKGYLLVTGYGEDEVLSLEESIPAPGAVCYHYNPDSITDVFLSARWVGRSKSLPRTITNLLRYSIFNSLIISINKVLQGAPVQFFLYKFIFDFGITTGILWKNEKEMRAK